MPDNDYKGIEYLQRQLAARRSRVLTRYAYYDAKNGLDNRSRIIPPSMQWVRPVLGWCAKAVNSLADRLVFDGFVSDDFYLGEIYDLNNSDILYDSAVVSAIITSCSFIYISAGEDGYPRLQVIDGGNATGVLDPQTKTLLREGYAVLERDPDSGAPKLEAYFLPHATWFYHAGGEPYKIDNPAPYPLLVPIINRPDAARPFGRSRISRAAMAITQSALRTLQRSEISAEFYSIPQKYVLGLSTEAEEMEKWQVTMSSFLDFRKDEDGDRPTVGQFTQQSMTPHIEQLKAIASLFAGETDLTLEDLGFSTGNPPSVEAIKASHEGLRLSARRSQRTLGSGFLNAGYLAACVRDNYAYSRSVFRHTKPAWMPIFEPDGTAFSGIGDGIYKINQAAPGYMGREAIKALTGIDGDISTPQGSDLTVD